MSKRLAAAIGFLLMIAIVAMVTGLWIAAVHDVDVLNILSAEGLRWLFVHSLDDPFHILPSCLLLLTMLGSWEECGFVADLRRPSSVRSRRAAFVTAFVFLMVLSLFLLAVCLPSSPLLGLTGRLFPSPLLRGIVPVLCFCMIAVAALHASLSGRMPSLACLFQFLSRSLGRHLPWLLVALLALFLFNLVCLIL